MSKMADGQVQCEDGEASFCVYTGAIDPKMERLLWHLEDEPMKDVVLEIASEFDIDAVMEACDKLFARAVEKNDARQKRLARETDPATEQSDPGLSKRASFIINPWQLIKRRTPTLASLDVCEIYRFLCGSNSDFPTKMLRRKPLEAAEKDLQKLRVNLDSIAEKEECASEKPCNIPLNPPPLFDALNTLIDTTSALPNDTNDQEIEHIETEARHDVAKSDFVSSYVLFGESDPPPRSPENTMSGDDFATDFLHMEIVEQLIADNFARDSDLLKIDPMPESAAIAVNPETIVCGSEPQGTPKISKVLHTKEQCSKSAPNGQNETRPSSRAVTTEHGGSFLEISGSSQASFLREIKEIHERLASSTPTCNICKNNERTKVILREMGTQTEEKTALDDPVRRTEFQCQIDIIERALLSHERRIRTIELWQDKMERKLEKLDSDSYSDYRALRVAHDELATEVNALRDVVKVLYEQAKVTGCKCKACTHGGASQGEREKEKEVQASLPSDTKRNAVCLPVTLADEWKKKPARKVNDSTYETFMKAAGKAIPVVAVEKRNPTGLSEYTFPVNMNDKQAQQPKPQRPPMRDIGLPKVMPPVYRPNDTSTPKAPAPREKDVSWAEIDDDEDNAIDDFIASVVISDATHTKTSDIPQESESAIPPKKASVAPETAQSLGAHSMNMPRLQRPRVFHERVNTSESPVMPRKMRNNVPAAYHTGSNPVQQFGNKPVPQKSDSNNVQPQINGIDVRIGNSGPTKSDFQFRGARPKTYSKAQSSNTTPGEVHNGRRIADSPPGNAEKDSYAKVVTKNGWNTVPPNKRKRVKSGAKPLASIQGLEQSRQRDVFVRGLAIAVFDTPEEMEEAIKYYCQERNVKINFARVMPNPYGNDTVGCRVSCSDDDYDALMNAEFWPNNVEVREWFHKPRERKPSRTFTGN